MGHWKGRLSQKDFYLAAGTLIRFERALVCGSNSATMAPLGWSPRLTTSPFLKWTQQQLTVYEWYTLLLRSPTCVQSFHHIVPSPPHTVFILPCWAIVFYVLLWNDSDIWKDWWKHTRAFLLSMIFLSFNLSTPTREKVGWSKGLGVGAKSSHRVHIIHSCLVYQAGICWTLLRAPASRNKKKSWKSTSAFCRGTNDGIPL
jgi:hypothetical protein